MRSRLLEGSARVEISSFAELSRQIGNPRVGVLPAAALLSFDLINWSEAQMQALQLYAIWTVLSVGAAGAFLAWWIM